MTTLRQVLAGSPKVIWTASRTTSVRDALAKMAEKNVGALVVIDDGKLVGIFTERHFARNVFLAGKTAPTTAIGEVMTTSVLVGRPDNTVDEALALMMSRGFRHLPVCDGDDVIGMVTMTDLVRNLVGEREITITQLQRYVYS